MKPNAPLTVFIQAPVWGSSRPAEVPTASSGNPMPSDSANRVRAPRSMSPVWAITVSAATRGGATQVVTTSADSAPITAVPMKVPLFCRPLAVLMRFIRAAGTCTS